jgi:hypothetical protein
MRGYDIQGEGARLLWDVGQASQFEDGEERCQKGGGLVMVEG